MPLDKFIIRDCKTETINLVGAIDAQPRPKAMGVAVEELPSIICGRIILLL
jgi:hypothetical protein